MEPRKRDPWLIIEDLMRVIRVYEAAQTNEVAKLFNQERIAELKAEVTEYLLTIYTSP